MDIYLEIGKTRVFAGAVGWPGWCRGARDEEGAVRALLAYGPRYATVSHAADLRPAFRAPQRATSFRVAERLTGDATTDFGAPSVAPTDDAAPVKPADLRRLRALMEASWAALDRAARSAAGVELAKGPRGGGRELAAILEHVARAEASYARRIGVHLIAGTGSDHSAAAREGVLDGLSRAVTAGIPAAGPRGGVMWSPRYFVRRASWHVLDHAWEIEDRAE